MQVVPDGRRCECGNRGCWEQYASGNVLVREARELAAANSPVAHRILERAGGDVAAITGPLITEAAQDGDPAARELFEEVGHWLGVGIANLAAALDPGTFVIGGGLSEAGDLLIGPARESFRRTPDRPAVPPRGHDRPGAARQHGRPGRRSGPGPAVRPAVPPGPGAGARPARAPRATRERRDRAAADVQRRRRLARDGLAGQPDDGDGGAAARGRRSTGTGSRRSSRHRLLARYPKFSMRPLPSGSPFEQPVWTDDPDFDLGRHLVDAGARRGRRRPGRVGQRAARHAAGHAALAVAVPPGRACRLPDGDRPTSALVARLHHCIADGIALASVLLSLTDDDPDTRPDAAATEAGARDPRRPGIRTRLTAGLARPRAGGGSRPARAAQPAAGGGVAAVRLAGTQHRRRSAARQPRPAHPALRPARHRQGRRVVAAARPRRGEAGRRAPSTRPSTTCCSR